MNSEQKRYTIETIKKYKDEVEEVEIVAYEMEDIHRLMKFAMEDNISTSLK